MTEKPGPISIPARPMRVGTLFALIFLEGTAAKPGEVGLCQAIRGSEHPMNGNSAERLTYVYRITPDDIIEFVNDAWIRFALENGTPILAQGVVGSSLWKHISGPQVVHLSRELLARVRESRCEANIPFRCDAPTKRRYMRMRILPLGKGKLEFGTWIEREEPYAEPIWLLDPIVPRGHEKFLRMCAWCKRIEVEEFLA